MTKLKIKELIKIFSDATKCSIQFNNCSCNSCFHNLNDKIDFKHICWLILLGLRGDYESSEIIESIKEEVLE